MSGLIERHLLIPNPPGKSLDATITTTKMELNTSRKVGVAIAHGAGGDMNSGHLPSVANALAEAGFPCLRFTCKPPSMAIRAKAMKAVLTEAPKLPEFSGVERWVLFGHSMGGRVACAAAAEAYTPILGCVLSSYPLHPPGKPENLRDDPLCELKMPIIFLRGSNDPLSTQEPWEAVQKRMGSIDCQVHEIEGADHSLKVKGGAAVIEETMAKLQEAVVKFVLEISSTGDNIISISGSGKADKEGAPEPERKQGLSMQLRPRKQKRELDSDSSKILKKPRSRRSR